MNKSTFNSYQGSTQTILFTPIVLLFFHLPLYAQSQLRLPKIFSSNMVLQRELPIPIWGWAIPNSSVSGNLNELYFETQADDQGRWKAYLPSQKAGGSYELKITSSGENVIFQNVMIGDVWLASGQSNMDRPLFRHLKDSTMLEDIDNHDIRLFMVDRDASSVPLDDLRSGKWKLCTKDEVLQFSAVGYYFANELSNSFDIPIGIIESNWGGTPVQSWMSEMRASSFAYFEPYIDAIHQLDKPVKEAIKSDNNLLHQRTELFNNSFQGIDQDLHLLEYDDRHWKEINLSEESLESEKIIWLRQEFEIKNIKSTKEMILFPHGISRRLDAWINGQRVLDNYYTWKGPKSIDHKIIKKGKNLITLRLANDRGLAKIQHNQSPFLVAVDSSWSLGFEGIWKMNSNIEPALPLSKYYYTYPMVLYNAMIKPIIPYGMKGVIWYQGESNTDKAYLYRELFPALIEDWRIQWGLDYFPFIYVQLANFMKKENQPTESDWAELREAQLMTLHQSNTGMAVTIDIGDASDIHPKNKWDVGHRLALQAKNIAYGENCISSGPIYESFQIDQDKIIIQFSQIGSGLECKEDSLMGFSIAGEDKQFFWANAEISDNKVIVWSPEVPEPKAVRYGWANNPSVNLYNKEGLPASPFRTDSWKGITNDRSY